jgi:lipoyl(octanoyl) transferase
VTSRPLERIDLGEVDYQRAMRDMREWVAQRKAGLAGDRMFLLGHPPVVTYGRRTPLAELPPETAGLPMVEVDRGGYATYHGPGQLVGYLVINVRERGPAGLVRWLENGLIEAMATLGFHTIRRDTPRGTPSLVGVWTPDHRKLVSIGMRVSGSVTSHGFAVNIDPDMTAFRRFVACGLQDVAMTSLRELATEHRIQMPTDAQVRDAIAASLGATAA